MSGVVFNQKHDSMFGKTGIEVTLNILKSNYKLFDKKFVPYILSPTFRNLKNLI